jgi:hypothetical protein
MVLRVHVSLPPSPLKSRVITPLERPRKLAFERSVFESRGQAQDVSLLFERYT